jgi:NADH-quinone oxidoreductase subunit J
MQQTALSMPHGSLSLLYTFHFYLFGLIAIASALLFVTRKSPVAAALWLVNTMFCLAALFVLLDAQFIGVIQVLVYAGGIVVLYLFVVMLVNLKRPPEAHQDPHRRTKLGFGLAAAVLVELGAIAAYGMTRPGPALVVPGVVGPMAGNTEQVGWLLYTSYLIPFEIASMLLLVAMIGAIVLAKREL